MVPPAPRAVSGRDYRRCPAGAQDARVQPSRPSFWSHLTLGPATFRSGMDYDDLLKLLRALHDQRVEYVLVGGVAMNLCGSVRATEGVDLFIRPTQENVARLRAALASQWSDDDIDGITAQDLAGRYPTIRYGPPGTDYSIDLLSRLRTAMGYDDLVWKSVQVEGVPVRLATPETLYRMKRNTLRPIDRADAQALRDLFGLED